MLDPEPPLGAHLETARVGYSHHGVYVGAGKVAQYSGFGQSQSGRIEEVTLAAFALGRAIRVVDHPNCVYAPQEIVIRARSRIGENAYRLLTNNCEHFCNWCITGRSHSPQTERPVALMLWGLARAARLLTALPATLASPGTDPVTVERLT